MGNTITLPDSKREVTFDLHKITLQEYMDLFDAAHPFADEQAMMERVSGVTVAEQTVLTIYDHKFLWREFRRVVRDPLDDPN